MEIADGIQVQEGVKDIVTYLPIVLRLLVHQQINANYGELLVYLMEQNALIKLHVRNI